LFKALTDAGIDTCFANPGTSEMQRIDNPTLNWLKIAEGHGVPATRATTAEEFHQQFAAAMSSQGPHLIEAQVAVTIQPMGDQIRKERK